MTDNSLNVKINSLLTGLKVCSEKHFIEFHKLFYSKILAYNMVLTKGDEQLSVSITHDTLLQFARKVKNLDSFSGVHNYLRRISRNLFIDYLRKECRRLDLTSISQSEASGILENEYNLNYQNLLNKLELGISQLSEYEAGILEQFYYKNISQKEIAESLQTSRKAVESKIARIKLSLKKIIMGDFK